jgi:glycosyltransferase involved in cell wall biosynthesis
MPTLLILSQVYVPDPASVGQHMHDAAAAMAARGWRVVVLTANRGYDDPTQKYPNRETRDGVEIRRLPFSSLGKRSIFIRLIGGCLFMLQCVVRGLFTPRLSCIMCSTSPPMCSVAAMMIGAVRRAPIKYWVMDLNPDQAIELGLIKERSWPARVFNLLNRIILKRAADIVALDRFMAERLNRKRPVHDKLTVLPPWPHEDHLDVLAHADNPFREKHKLAGKFVIMYSGNHSLASPLTTILQAALKVQDDPRLVFMFIGGGLGKKEVEACLAEHKPANIISLPYQPLADLKYSLSAADVHLVAMGQAMVGCIHPCKVYGAMAVARPLIILGPRPSHATDIVEEHDLGWHIEHGDVEGAVKLLRSLPSMDANGLDRMGRRAKDVISTRLSKESLCGRFCDVLERGITQPREAAAHGSRPARSARVEQTSGV